MFLSPLGTNKTQVINHQLSDNEIFLLHYLNGRMIKYGIDKPVKQLFPDFNKTMTSLKKNGYLEEDDHSYFLQCMNVFELKNLLKKLSLSTTGKKNELINRIISNTTEEFRESICPDLYYVLSPVGLEVDSKYIETKKENTRQMKECAFVFIKQGKFEKASLEKAKFYSSMPIPPGIGIDWSDKKQIKAQSKKCQEELKRYNFADLDNSQDYKDLLFKILYYDVEIENNLNTSIIKFIELSQEQLNCQNLDAFFEKKNYVPTENEKVFVYLDTKRYNRYQETMTKTSGSRQYNPLPPNEFKVSDSTIQLWKEYQEFSRLSNLKIKNFPKTFNTFQKHKHQNSEKYQSWIK